MSLLTALEGFTSAELSRLLAGRPDLASPPPADLSELAERAAAAASAHRALESLNRPELVVAEALVVFAGPPTEPRVRPAGETPEPRVRPPRETPEPDVKPQVHQGFDERNGGLTERLAEFVGFDPSTALERLRALALVWEFEPTEGLRQAFAPYAGGLANPSGSPLTPAEIDRALKDLPKAALGVLHKLKWGPPTGSVRNAEREIATPGTPIEHLLVRGLLRPAGPNTVILPREVALHLRGGFLPEPVIEPPHPEPGERPARLIDSAAIGTATEFTIEVEGLLDELARRQPAPLRTGGLASRDLTVLARAVHAPLDRAAFALEVAYAAGLLTATGPAIVPNESFDQWLTLPLPERWTHLARHWYRTPRWPAAAHDDPGRPLLPDIHNGPSSSPEVRWPSQVRQAVLKNLAPGDQVDLGQLAAWAEWRRPALAEHGHNTLTSGARTGTGQATEGRKLAPAKRGGNQPDPSDPTTAQPEPSSQVLDRTRAVLQEAEWLGLSSFGQASILILALEEVLPDSAIALFPEFVDHLILQSDLTAIATGPLDRYTAAALALLADTESRGGGGVFRFTATSIQRALNAGWSGAEIERWLTDHSRTGLPQPLHYLIEDIARRHGTVRVGAARAYVRIDDPARLSLVLAHPAADELGLHQVGPQALVADADAGEVVELLRAVGLAPAAENAAGELLASTAPRRPPARTRRTSPDPDRLADALIARRDSQRTTARTESTLTLLQRAAQQELAIEVNYVAPDGTPAVEILTPIDLAPGTVRFAGAGAGLSLPLARITAVHLPTAH